MYQKIRQVHGLNVTRDQVYAAMIDVDPEGLEKKEANTQEKENEEYIFFC